MSVACDLFNVEPGCIHEMPTRRESLILLKALPPSASRPNCFLTALNIYPRVPEPRDPLEAAGPGGSSWAGPDLSLPGHLAGLCSQT